MFNRLKFVAVSFMKFGPWSGVVNLFCIFLDNAEKIEWFRWIRDFFRSFIVSCVRVKLPDDRSYIVDDLTLKISSRSDYLRKLKYYAPRRCLFDSYKISGNFQEKVYQSINFAVYFQCYANKSATREALVSLRKFYRDVPVMLFSDCGDSFEDLAIEFGCDYIYGNENLGYWPCKDMLKWFDRLKTACLRYNDVDWIILMEDDVRVRDKISKYPDAHIAGQGGGKHFMEGGLFYTKKSLTKIRSVYPALEINGFSGCGGTIFHRESFLKCMDNISVFNPDELYNLDRRLTWATDISLTYLFMLNGFINRRWLDYSAETEGDFGVGSAFDHQYKLFYE